MAIEIHQKVRQLLLKGTAAISEIKKFCSSNINGPNCTEMHSLNGSSGKILLCIPSDGLGVVKSVYVRKKKKESKLEDCIGPDLLTCGRLCGQGLTSTVGHVLFIN